MERFSLLSPDTSGPRMKIGMPDKEAAKSILRNVKREDKVDLNKNDAQLGKTKLFVRTPEMYFEFERLRIVAIGVWATKIQRVYRRYSSRRHLIKKRDEMAKLYEAAGKRRRRGERRKCDKDDEKATAPPLLTPNYTPFFAFLPSSQARSLARTTATTSPRGTCASA